MAQKERVWQNDCWAGDGEIECLPPVDYVDVIEADELCDNSFVAVIKLEIPDWKQNDKRWREIPYGPDDSWSTYGAAGCGVCSYAMCLEYYELFDDDYSVKDKILAVGTYAYKHGYRKKGKGTSSGLFNTYTNSERFSSVSRVQDAIDDGHPVILNVKAGWPDYKGSGHYVLVVGYDSNGNYLINDPGSNQISRRKVKLEKYWKYVKAAFEIVPKNNKL